MFVTTDNVIHADFEIRAHQLTLGVIDGLEPSNIKPIGSYDEMENNCIDFYFLV